MFNITPEEAKKQFTSLSFNGKRVVADLFGHHKATFVAEIDKEITLSAIFTLNGKEIESDKVDHIFPGPPVGVIKGISLFFLDTFIPYSLLKSLPKKIDLPQLKALMSEYEVIILGEIPKEKGRIEWIDPYGMTVKLLTPSLEKELLSSGYRKQGGVYYCPKNNVFKATETLKSIGFDIINQAGQEVVPLTAHEMHYEFKKELELTVTLQFHDESIELSLSLALPQNKIGLLPDNFKLAPLLKEGRYHDKKWILPKKFAGLVLDQFVPPETETGTLNVTLRPYQEYGVRFLNFLYDNGFSGGLLADDMGLGKTVQTLSFLTRIKGPILIIVPTSLLFNWQREINKFCPAMKVSLYHGANRDSDFKNGIILTSYGLIRNDLPHFQKIHFDTIVLDEAQLIKNRASETYGAVSSLSSNFKLAITGTPVENRLDELKSHFRFLVPDLIDDEDSIATVRKKIAPFTLRRTKKEVLSELPDRIDETLIVEMTEAQARAYQELIDCARIEEMDNPIHILELILRLRQTACHPLLAGLEVDESGKTDLILKDIETQLIEGQKVLVFSQFTSYLKLIRKRFPDALYFDGETRNRDEVVDAFQKGENPLLLMSLKAGGVGLNLTRADTVMMIDPWWNDKVEEQAISRAHRMGREAPVYVRRYLSKGSIEEKIEALKGEKKALF
ncbi:MAG: DEAD/DEAH box helicase, partial [Parachlamydiaceae bacterium]